MRYATSHQKEISGAIAGETSSTSTRFPITNLISPHLHYLPFASGFPLPHFTIYLSFSYPPLHQFAIFIRLSFSFAVFLTRSVFACTLVCLFAFMSLIWILIHSLVSSRNPLMRIQLLVN